MDLVKLLSGSDKAVERAVLAILEKGKVEPIDNSSLKYYASWIKAGKKLSGKHLVKARALTVKHVAILEAIAKKEVPIEPSRFILNREGTFHIETVPGTDHCGTLPSFDVKYHVKAECSALLDSRGFLVDQILIDRYFQTIRRVAVSCEKLAQGCLSGVKSVLLRDNPTLIIHGLEVTLSPAPYAARMTCILLTHRPTSKGRLYVHPR